ncbi:hypothetical protein ACLOJK_041305 [Asimina triloba]
MMMQDERPKARGQEATSQLVWDCESRLYDSYELKSFNQQLDSAISSRTVSMPHISSSAADAARGGSSTHAPTPLQKRSKITRSIHKLVRLVFGTTTKPTSAVFVSYSGGYYGFDRGGVLPTIPEVWENSKAVATSPELDYSLVRKTASERFTAGPTLSISQPQPQV